MLISLAAAALVGTALVLTAAYEAGTMPRPPASYGFLAGVGAALLAVALGSVVALMVIRRCIGLPALIAMAAAGALIYLSVPAWNLALFRSDPGFVVSTFTVFEWSPAARYVIFPALVEATALLLVIVSTVGLLVAVRKAPIGRSARRA